MTPPTKLDITPDQRRAINANKSYLHEFIERWDAAGADEASLNPLIDEFQAECKARNLPLLSASDMLAEGADLVLEPICEIIRAAGFPAYVEFTGGGCATIYAGEPVQSADGPRYPIIAGPGSYGPPSLASLEEFWFGPDDDGATAATPITAGNEQAVADQIIAALRKTAQTGTEACAHCLGDLVRNPQGDLACTKGDCFLFDPSTAPKPCAAHAQDENLSAPGRGDIGCAACRAQGY